MSFLVAKFRKCAAAVLLCAGLISIMLGAGGCAHPDERGSYPAPNHRNGLPDVTLIDQHGKPVALPSLRGMPTLVDFIYTRCTQSCPMLTMKMSEVARRLGPQLGKQIRIVSISVDPQNDTPAALLAYAKSHEADRPGWLFLTGTPEQIASVLKAYNLKIAREPDGSITHVTEAFLLDADGRQHRFYDGLQVRPTTIAGDIERAEHAG
jgi:protein SCO1/2